MPTITIQAALTARSRRLVALRLTRWLVDEGVPADHAIIRFADLPEDSVFVAGLPAAALPHEPGVPAHAAVSCQIGPERDEDFRARLATEITTALPDGDRIPFIYLAFRPTARADVWIGRHGQVQRADAPATARSTR